MMIGIEVTANQAEQNDGKEGGAQNDVETVEARQHVEQRTVSTRIKTQIQVLVGVHVFVSLAGHKGKAQDHGGGQPEDGFAAMAGSSEERRVGKECGSTCRSRWGRE